MLEVRDWFMKPGEDENSSNNISEETTQPPHNNGDGTVDHKLPKPG